MIYHYCNTSVFNSIIATKQIWLTDITKLNDCSEYRSGLELIREVLEEKGLAEKQFSRDIHASRLNNNFKILVGCFSHEGDAGSQWRLYADESKGLSIGFDESEIEQFSMFNRFTENSYHPITSHVKLYRVIYNRLDFIKEVTNFIDSMEQNNPALKDTMIALGLRRLAAIYKDPYFQDEREIRAIAEIEANRDDTYALDERINAYNERASYHKLLTSYQNLSAIKVVMIGANCPYTLEDVKGVLQVHGLEGITVRHSSGRGRYRTAPEA